MSNSQAIAAVTATLRLLLEKWIDADPLTNLGVDAALTGTTVTARPPDEAATLSHSRHLNLFLYQADLNAAWRNADLPGATKPGETGRPPLPLTLSYLLTSYARDENEDTLFLSHRLLGRAMSILHDHPVLGKEEVKVALAGNDLHAQIERVRITPQPLSLDEMSKLWSAFQTHYRLSAAYQVSVVLIESTLPAKTPLPVLTRGHKDEGVTSQADLTSPFPTLLAVTPPNGRPAALLDDVVALSGHHLEGTNATVVLRHPRLKADVSLPVEPGGSDTALAVRIPNQPNNFLAGAYRLSVNLIRPGETFPRATAELPLLLSPQLSAPAATRVGQEIKITVNVNPTVLPEQRAALLLGSEEIVAQPHTTNTNQLDFVAQDEPSGRFAPGDYFIRLRVDGADSPLINYQAKPPAFDASQKVTLP